MYYYFHRPYLEWYSLLAAFLVRGFKESLEAEWDPKSDRLLSLSLKLNIKLAILPRGEIRNFTFIWTSRILLIFRVFDEIKLKLENE